MKKVIALSLIVVIFAAIISGCAASDSHADVFSYLDSAMDLEQSTVISDTPVTTPWESPSSHVIDFDEVFAVFPPETVMIDLGDLSLTWGELFFYIYSNVSELLALSGGTISWSTELSDGFTFADSVLEYSTEYALMFKSIEFGALELGVSLSAEIWDLVQEEIDQMIDIYGSEEEMLRSIWTNNGCHSLELLEYFISMYHIEQLIFNELFGAAGEKLSDEQLLDITADDGYMMAMHIRRVKDDDDGEEEDAAIEEIEGLFDQLTSYDGDDFDQFFTDLMFEHSDDSSGLGAFPLGYLFTAEHMIEEFSETTAALEIGEFSEVVESENAFHIIYRLPINFDVIPLGLFMQGVYNTLRLQVASDMLDSKIVEWQIGLEVTYSTEYESLDLAKLLEGGE